MANNHASGTFAPYIPSDLITDDFKKLAEAVGASLQPFNDDDSMVYLFNEDYCTSGHIENEDGTEKEVSDDDLYAGLQDIIRRSEGRLTWISHEQAYTCDKMRSGEFGGSAVFITADNIQYHGTSSWLERRIGEAEGYDTEPDTEGPIADPVTTAEIIEATNELLSACSLVIDNWETGNLAGAVNNLALTASYVENTIKNLGVDGVPPDGTSPPTLAIVIDGGIVQTVVTDHPELFSDVRCVIVDYDVDAADPLDDSIGVVVQQDGTLSDAYIQETMIDRSGIDLKEVVAFIDDTSYGAAQVRVAVYGDNPCDNCNDINSDGERCVNEEKCLAWRRYQTWG